MIKIHGVALFNVFVAGASFQLTLNRIVDGNWQGAFLGLFVLAITGAVAAFNIIGNNAK